MRKFRLRRLEKVNIEALLIASGQNVKRLLAFGDRRPKKPAQAAALRPPAAVHEICHVREYRSSRPWRPRRAFFNSVERFWDSQINAGSSPSCVEKLSEKGYERRSERGFGRYTEHEKGLGVVCRPTLWAPLTLFIQSQKMNSPKLRIQESCVR